MSGIRWALCASIALCLGLIALFVACTVIGIIGALK